MHNGLNGNGQSIPMGDCLDVPFESVMQRVALGSTREAGQIKQITNHCQRYKDKEK